jgi:CubicO group peptidase (beta-lactamase class C family)
MNPKPFARFILVFALAFSTFLTSLPAVGYAQVGAAPATATEQYSKALTAIEEKTDARRRELGIPGMSLVIVKDDQIIYSKGLGFKDFENKVPVTADTEFAIGSATKAFTALSVLMTADEGKIALNASPKTVLPYFKMADPDTDKNMTILDLMTHSSGLNRTDIAMITGKLTRQELIRVAGEAKPIGKLHEKFGYQNLMFTAAGEVVSVAQKTPWEKFVPERIFKPLGMTNSVMSIKQMEKAKDYSYGYSYNFDTKATQKLPFREIQQVAPAGSINSSANDMAKWLRFVMNGGVTADGKRLVSEKSYAEWLKPQMKITPTGSVQYGLGWFIQKWNGLTVVQHGGNIDGFNSMVAMIPEKKLGFVMLTNVSASSLGAELMPIVWKNILGEPEAPKVDSSAPEVAPEKEAGKYKFEAAGFDIDVQWKDGKLIAIAPGQPTFTLERVAGRKYKLNGAPEGFFMTFKDKELYLEQPGANFTLPRIDPNAATSAQAGPAKEEKPVGITVDELHAKALEAMGGEANWRKITSRVSTAEVDLEQQGVKAKATSWSQAPNMSATETMLYAVGKEIAKGWEFFDGTNGEEVYSFAPAEKLAGKRLEDAKLGSDFYGMLDWKTKYKSIKVTKIAPVGLEDAYVVEFEPEKGTKFTEYYSTKTFLLLKREGVVPSSTSSQSLPYTVTYKDYRLVDGVMLPFMTVNNTPSNGDVVTTIKSVKHNIAVDNKIFAPRKL